MSDELTADESGQAEETGLLAQQANPETPEGQETAEAQSEAPDSPPDIPETYELQIDGPVDETRLQEAHGLFKELALNQEQAQKLTDFSLAMQKEMHDTMVTQWQQQQKAWADQVRADPEIGGKALSENLGLAQKVIGKYGDADLIDQLEQIGMSSHPGLIRLLAKIGKEAGFQEDHVHAGSSLAGSAKQDPAKLFYPTMN